MSKKHLFEQKVDLKPKTLDLRHLGIFADSEKSRRNAFQNPRFRDKSPNLVTLNVIILPLLPGQIFFPS